MANDTNDTKGFRGILGLDPTLGIGDKVLTHIQEAQKQEQKRLEKSDYYGFCSHCGKKQIRQQLLEQGCYLCGWKGTEEELETAQAKEHSDLPNTAEEPEHAYRMHCPNCGASVLTAEFMKKGCWRCGYNQ
jgi:ribosomal protein L34E